MRFLRAAMAAAVAGRVAARHRPRAPSKRSTCAIDSVRDRSHRRGRAAAAATATASRSRPRRAPTASSAASRCARARPAPTGRCSRSPTTSDEQIDRLIVVPHYPHGRLGHALARPRRSRASSTSRRARATGPDRAGQRRPPTSSASRSIPARSITYVAELRTDKLPQLYLWEPDAYKDKVNSFTLYHGIVIGIAGLLALFLTILFVVKGSVMFPAAAALGWAVLVYIGIDFGFWGKVFDMSAGAERDLARLRRGDPRRHAAGVPVRLSQPQSLARALPPHHRRLAGLPRRAGRRSRCSIRRSPRASRGMSLAARRRRRLRRWSSTSRPRLRPRGAADPDLAPAGGLGVRRRPRRHRRR